MTNIKYYRDYHPNGQLAIETPYIEGDKTQQKHGTEVCYIGKGWRVRTPYSYGKKHGIEKWYYESGKVYKEIPYSNNKIHGIEKWYYEDGTPERKITYVQGKKHGVEKEFWHESVIPRIEISYQNDNKHGLEKWYHDNGNIEAKFSYRQGKRHGEEIWYNEDGDIENTEYHLYGNLVTEEEYIRHELEEKLSGLR